MIASPLLIYLPELEILVMNFASRGTKTIYAVDANFNCIKFINTTAKELELDIITYKSDVYKFLEKTPLKADIIFC